MFLAKKEKRKRNWTQIVVGNTRSLTRYDQPLERPERQEPYPRLVIQGIPDLLATNSLPPKVGGIQALSTGQT